MIRDDIKAALVGAMKGGDKAATQTLRLIQSAIKNRDIELRTAIAAARRRRAGHRSHAEDDQATPRIGRPLPPGRPRGARRGRRSGDRRHRTLPPAQLGDAEASAAIQSIIADPGASAR